MQGLRNRLMELFLGLLLRWSVRRGVMAITLISVLLSILLTALIVGSLFGGDALLMKRSLAIAATVSLMVAPVTSFSVLKLMHELEVARAAVHAASITDSLTGTPNRRYFFDAGERNFLQANANAAALSAILFDIDDFKLINDRYGHAAGDTALRQVSEIAGRHIRGSDVLARIGGEEFSVLLPGARGAEAMEIAQRIRGAIEAATFVVEGAPALRVTVSAGVSTLDRHPTFQDLIGAADRALYRAKGAGKNRCEAANQPA
jgi:diguanylate cyclase (GGDEF)-like protein